MQTLPSPSIPSPQPAAPQPQPPAHPAAPRLGLIVLTLSLVVVGAWLVVMPGGILGHADLVGYAVCHRISTHSIFLGGQQLPWCARCTGTYLGALAAFAVMFLLRRRRAGNLPPVAVLIALASFVAVMGIDGVNSYLTLFPGAPHLYEPQNWLRLATGTLEGIALACVTLPIFNQTVWADARGEPSVRDMSELGVMAIVGAGLAGLVLAGPPALLYPLALLSSGSVLWMLTLINSVLFTIITRQENRALAWRAAAPLLLAGLAVSLVELSAVDFGRAYITRLWGLPF